MPNDEKQEYAKQNQGAQDAHENLVGHLGQGAQHKKDEHLEHLHVAVGLEGGSEMSTLNILQKITLR